MPSWLRTVLEVLRVLPPVVDTVSKVLPKDKATTVETVTQTVTETVNQVAPDTEKQRAGTAAGAAANHASHIAGPKKKG